MVQSWELEKTTGQAVKKAARQLRPIVASILPEMAPDWTGEKSLFVNVVLKDRAVAERGLTSVYREAQDKIRQTLKAAGVPYFVFARFRTESDEVELRRSGQAWSN